MVYKLSHEKTSAGAATLAQSKTLGTQNKSDIKNENILNKELDEKLHK